MRRAALSVKNIDVVAVDAGMKQRFDRGASTRRIGYGADKGFVG